MSALVALSSFAVTVTEPPSSASVTGSPKSSTALVSISTVNVGFTTSNALVSLMVTVALAPPVRTPEGSGVPRPTVKVSLSVSASPTVVRLALPLVWPWRMTMPVRAP